MWNDDVSSEISELFEASTPEDLGGILHGEFFGGSNRDSGSPGREAFAVVGDHDLRWSGKVDRGHGRAGRIDLLAEQWLQAQDDEARGAVLARCKAEESRAPKEEHRPRRSSSEGADRCRPVGGEARRPDLHGGTVDLGQVKALARVGLSTRELGRRLGIGRERVRRLLNGEAKVTNKGAELLERDAKVLALVAELPHATKKVLSEQLGMTPEQVRTAMRRLGLAKTRGGKKKGA